MKTFSIATLTVIAGLVILFSTGSPAQSQGMCGSICDGQLYSELQSCEQYLIPDGNGGWTQSSQYDSCVDLAHLLHDFCMDICSAESGPGPGFCDEGFESGNTSVWCDDPAF